METIFIIAIIALMAFFGVKNYKKHPIFSFFLFLFALALVYGLFNLWFNNTDHLL